MHKLVILIESIADWQRFEAEWPGFLRLAESMPGLQREATSRVERFLYGKCQYAQVHELFFNSLAEAEIALASPQGEAAGSLLQQITSGRMTLFFADHKEDEMENIRKYKPADETPE
jgi:uncharacterized protein (TIGR02118 family)